MAELSFSAADEADLGSSGSRSITQKLLPHPGEDAYLHLGTQWRESTERTLASMSLLHPAKGGMTLRATGLVDFPVDRLPRLDPADANYAKVLDLRLKADMQNERNMKIRYDRTLEDWTAVYTLVVDSLEQSMPLLVKELKVACDLHARGEVEVEGRYDGPLAYSAALAVLPQTSGTDRTRSKLDKEFYETLERLQKSPQHKLPDGCSADEFTKRAGTWIVHIEPNLARRYDPVDAADFIIDLLPSGLAESGRRIKKDMTRDGNFTDLMAVAKECRIMRSLSALSSCSTSSACCSFSAMKLMGLWRFSRTTKGLMIFVIATRRRKTPSISTESSSRCVSYEVPVWLRCVTCLARRIRRTSLPRC